MTYFKCPECKLEIENDLELIHGHVRTKHFEKLIDRYTLELIKDPSNWVEK
jgi:hypothetical protein